MRRCTLSVATLAALVLPVVAGIGWLAVSGAPMAWVAVNSGALLLALALAVLLPMPQDARYVAALGAALIAALFATALAGIAVDGIRRWVSFGPINLHVGYLLLPVLAALAPSLSSGRAVALLVMALLATLLQPDRAASMALVAALAAFAHVRRDRASFIGLIIAIASASAAVVTPDPLAPVRWVEGVQSDAWQVTPIAGIALTAATLSPLFLLRHGGTAALPLASLLVTAGLMAFTGPYPSILIGFGAAPILGFGMALAVLRDQREPA